MFSDKTAMGMAQIASIIAILVAFLVLIPLNLNLTRNVEESTEGAACRAMLKAQGLSESNILIPNFKNSCATTAIDISLKNKDKEDVLKEIAQRMTNAWWIVNQGKTKGLWSNKGILGSSGYDCMIVYSIRFTDVDKKAFEGAITQDEVRSYMSNRYKNDDMTYHQYIQHSGGAGVWEVTSDLDNFQRTDFAISLASPKTSWSSDLFGTQTDATTVILLSSLEDANKNKGCDFI